LLALSGTRAIALRELPAGPTMSSPPLVVCYTMIAGDASTWVSVGLAGAQSGAGSWSCAVVALSGGRVGVELTGPGAAAGTPFAIVAAY
jgi:hypothetical protein